MRARGVGAPRAAKTRGALEEQITIRQGGASETPGEPGAGCLS